MKGRGIFLPGLSGVLLLGGLSLGGCGDAEPSRFVAPMTGARDKAVWTAARANLDTLRTALAAYAAGTGENLFPAGSLDYDALRALLPGANLPPSPIDARFAEFGYEAAPDRESYRITVRVNDREGDVLVAAPSGVEPSAYPR